MPDPDIETIKRALKFVHVEPEHDNALDALSRLAKRVGELENATGEINRLYLVIESAVRFSDGKNYVAVLHALDACVGSKCRPLPPPPETP